MKKLDEIVKRYYPDLVANELVSVQPLNSPTSEIFKFVFNEKQEEIEIDFRPPEKEECSK
ncbi:MAG: hypothetical protein ACI4V7_05140 [Succinivibrionaceae bacterium]